MTPQARELWLVSDGKIGLVVAWDGNQPFVAFEAEGGSFRLPGIVARSGSVRLFTSRPVLS